MAALLLFSTTPPLSSLSSSSSSPSASTSAISATPLLRLRLHKGSICSYLFNGLQSHTPFIHKQRGMVVVKASSEVDGTSPDSAVPPSDGKEESVSVENLPLESKLQLKLEQKIKMKLAKKIRLRRKRLVRKRHLRKKGRWPPSKMKKNKNV